MTGRSPAWKASGHWGSKSAPKPGNEDTAPATGGPKPQRPLDPGEEADANGEPGGVDPRTLTPNQLRALGHDPMMPSRVIRAKCLECCCGSPSEVRHCVIITCPSWPYRMGTNPFRQPSEAQREAWRRSGERLQARAGDRP